MRRIDVHILHDEPHGHFRYEHGLYTRNITSRSDQPVVYRTVMQEAGKFLDDVVRYCSLAARPVVRQALRLSFVLSTVLLFPDLILW